MITVHNLYKSFGKVNALQGVSFEAPDGKITGLLGPNGAGKTTTLRILYTLLKPDQGSAEVDGHDTVRDPLEVQRAIGALPDSHGLYPRLTARENIQYFGRLHGMKSAQLDTRVDELIEMFEMQEIASRRADGFSTGERMKVSIARALIHSPNHVLLDEPTNGLDVPGTRAMRAIIQRLRDDGKCVIFSSHIMQEVAALCDQIVVIAHGQVAASGTADDLLRQTGKQSLEDAFVSAVGSSEGLIQ